MTTREDRKNALHIAIEQSKNGVLTYVLIKGDKIHTTQNQTTALAYARAGGYKVYAKCKDGYMIL